MRARRSLLNRPGCSTVRRRENATVSSHRPATRWIVGSKRDRVEMILRWRRNFEPFVAAVSRFNHQSARANRKRMLPIEHVQAIQSIDEPRRLILPTKATVIRVKNHAVSADGPAVQLVAGETNCADRIPLRQRILPFPTATRVLRRS